jgi:fucose permease
MAASGDDPGPDVWPQAWSAADGYCSTGTDGVVLFRNEKTRLAYALSLNYAAMACLAIGLNLVPVFLTTLSADLGGSGGLTNEQLGRIGGTIFLGLVIGILAAGPLADRFGPKRFVILGNLLTILGLALMALASSYALLLAAVLIIGLGSGCLDMVLSPIVCALQPQRKASAMNWLHSFYCTGAVGTILLAALALKLGLGWRTICGAMTVLPLLVTVGFLGLKIPPLVATGHDRTRVRHLVKQGPFLLALAAIFLAGGTELGLAQWLPAYAEKGLGYTTETGAMALLVFSVAMALGRILAGLLGHRLDTVKMMFWCCVASVVLFLATCFAPWSSIALSAAMAAGLAGSCLWPSMLAVAADRFPRGGASMFGLLAALGNAGGIFAPWVVGIVADHSNMSWGLSTAIVCPLGMAIVLLWIKR